MRCSLNKWLVVWLSIILVCLGTIFVFGQIKEDESYKKSYEKLKQIKLLRSEKKDVESLFAYTSKTEGSAKDGFLTVYYELGRAKLTVDYSTGRCSKHGTTNGYDVDQNVVIGIDLFFYDEMDLSHIEFDLSDFESYEEPDNNAVIYTNDQLGIKVTGGEGLLHSIEYFPTEKEETKYRCGG